MARAVLWSGQIPESSFDPLPPWLSCSLRVCRSIAAANKEKLAGHYVCASLKISSLHSLSGPLMVCLHFGLLKCCSQMKRIPSVSGLCDGNLGTFLLSIPSLSLQEGPHLLSDAGTSERLVQGGAWRWTEPRHLPERTQGGHLPGR